jgi:hypothetical protein
MPVHELTKCVIQAPNHCLGLTAGPNGSKPVTRDDVTYLCGTRLSAGAVACRSLSHVPPGEVGGAAPPPMSVEQEPRALSQHPSDTSTGWLPLFPPPRVPSCLLWWHRVQGPPHGGAELRSRCCGSESVGDAECVVEDRDEDTRGEHGADSITAQRQHERVVEARREPRRPWC